MKAFTLVTITLLVSAALGIECSARIVNDRSPDNKYTVTYDLSPLVHSEQWTVKETDLQARNYSYVFNLCKPVKRIISWGVESSTCENNTSTNELYAAYQISSMGCYRLTGDLETVKPTWTPIDYDDPTTGVTITYGGGDSKSCQGKDRSLRLSFYCMNNPTSLPSEASVVEYPACTYNIQMESQYGCPVSCGEYNRALCGGQGVCGFDRDNRRARCFCNDGYYGTACEKEGSDLNVMSSTSTILLCVCGFLVIVEIGVLIMWNKVKGLRLDPAAYANLNKENMGMIDV